MSPKAYRAVVRLSQVSIVAHRPRRTLELLGHSQTAEAVQDGWSAVESAREKLSYIDQSPSTVSSIQTTDIP